MTITSCSSHINQSIKQTKLTWVALLLLIILQLLHMRLSWKTSDCNRRLQQQQQLPPCEKIFSSSSCSSCDLSNLHRNHVMHIKQTNKHTCWGRSITKWSSWICSKSFDCWNLTSQLQLYQKILSWAYRSKSQNLQNCTFFFFFFFF